jgi:hypothetical protein
VKKLPIDNLIKICYYIYVKEGNDTMTEKKMTKRDYFNQILTNYNLTPEHVAFINHELELLARKNASATDKKPTATQVENDRLKAIIADFLRTSGNAYTVTDMIKSCPELSDLTNQKVSRLANDLVDENCIVKFSEKRKTYFKA